MEDIEYFLRHDNLHFQSQGFSTLIATLKVEKNEKNQRRLRNLLFNCLLSSHAAVSKWASVVIRTAAVEESLENVLGSSVSVDSILNDVSARLHDAKNPSPIVDLLLELADSKNLTSLLLRLSITIPASRRHTILSHLRKMEVKKILALGIRLIHAKDIDSAFKRAVIELCLRSSIKESDLEKLFDATENVIPLDLLFRLNNGFWRQTRLLIQAHEIVVSEDQPSTCFEDDRLLFNLVDIFGSGNPEAISTLLNHKFIEHPVLLAPLMNSILAFQELIKANASVVSSNLMLKMKATLEKFRSAQITVSQEPVRNFTDYFRWIVSEESRLFYQLHYWNLRKTNVEAYVNLKSVAFLFGLYSHVTERHLDDFLDLCCWFSCQKCYQSLVIFLHFTYFAEGNETRKRKLLRNLAKLNGHKVLIRQVFKFLLAVSKTPLYDGAIEALGELWQLNQWLINEKEMTTFLNISLSADGVELASAKMNLYLRICKTEHGETLVSNLLSLLNVDSNDILTKVVYAFADLSRRKIIESVKINGKLSNLAQKETTIVAYVDFLAASTENDADFTFIVKCCQTLWSFLTNSNKTVRAATWKALSKFQLDQLLEISELSIAETMEEPKLSGILLFGNVENEESDYVYENFCEFLHSLIGFDIESLPRTIYTENVEKPSSEDPLISILTPILNDTSNARGNELAALSLIDPFNSRIPQLPKRLQKSMTCFSNALLRISLNPELPFEETLESLAGWKHGTEALLKICLEARRKNSPTFSVSGARDIVVDEMRRAMDQIKEATVNVVIALPFLSNAVSELVLSEDKTAISAHNHWQISVLEFLLELISVDYKPRSHPLFQKAVEPNELLSRMAAISAALILSRRDSFDFTFLENVVINVSNYTSKISGPINWIPEFVDAVLSINEKCYAENSGLYSVISRLKSGRISSPVCMGLFKHRHDIKILANVLDVDEMTTEIYLDLIPIDSVAEAQFLQWLDGQAKQVDSNIAWNLFMETNESIKQKYAYKLAKTIEKSTKMDKSSLTKLLNSFRRFFIGNTRERRSIRLPTDYNKLPEKSILRETLQQIRNVKSPKRRKMLLSSLIDHRRTDGRSLPPLDWTVLLNSELAYEDYSILFLLAIQQANVKLITKLLASGHVEGIGFNVIQQIGNENLQRLAEILSKSSQRHLIHIICQKCASIDWRPECESLCAAIQKLAMKNEEIVNELAQFIPNIETVQSFEHPFFRYFGTLSGLSMKSASILFRFWADIRKDMKMEEIVSRLLNIDRKLRDGCLIILMRFWSSKSVDECYELLSKMIPLVRISRNQETAIGDQQVLTFWEIFIVLVCSSPVMPVPLCSYADSDTETWTTIVGLFTDSFYEWIKYRSENIEFVNTIVLFICELRSISSLSNDIKEILNQCLRRCINQNSNVTEIIDNQNLWMDIF